jgi:hypothetical protein
MPGSPLRIGYRTSQGTNPATHRDRHRSRARSPRTRSGALQIPYAVWSGMAVGGGLPVVPAGSALTAFGDCPDGGDHRARDEQSQVGEPPTTRPLPRSQSLKAAEVGPKVALGVQSSHRVQDRPRSASPVRSLTASPHEQRSASR